MTQNHVPKNPIKPPLHYLEPNSAVPSLPRIESQDAITALTSTEWSSRVIVGRHIRCLRQIVASLIAMDSLPPDFDQVVFDRVVIEEGDLSELEIPFKLHFQDAFFVSGLNLNSSRFPFLSVSGYIGHGLGLVETQGAPMVNLANLVADQVHIYGGGGLSHLDVANSTIGALTVASTTVERNIYLCDTVVAPDGLWCENITIGEGMHLTRSSVQKYFRIHDVSCTGDIALEVCNLDCPLSTRNSTCATLSLSESTCPGRLDLRYLSFHALNVSNTSVPGQLLLGLDQLQLTKNGSKSTAQSHRKWDAPPKLMPQKSATLGEVVTVAEQLITLHENFKRMPISDAQERYCAYQLADSTWQICHWRAVNSLMRWIARQGFGYLLFPWRIVRTMALHIVFFAALFFTLPQFGIGALSFSNGTPVSAGGIALSICRCLYFSTLTFCTSVYGDIYPVGLLKPIAAGEAFAGLVIVALFVVSVARRLFRW